MLDQINAIMQDEANWLPIAMLVSVTAVGAQVKRRVQQGIPPRSCALGALNLFYGTMLGFMASGHLLVVTMKLFQGTLQGEPWFLYSFGLALAIPAWWLAAVSTQRAGGVPLVLNGWLGAGLLLLGLHNWPLATPALLNIAHRFHGRPLAGWAIVAVASVGYAVLFASALVFMMSGQTFEEFQGLTN